MSRALRIAFKILLLPLAIILALLAYALSLAAVLKEQLFDDDTFEAEMHKELLTEIKAYFLDMFK